MRDRVLAARQNTAYLEVDDVGLPEDTESFRIANPMWPGLFLGAWAWEGGGGGGECPRPITLKLSMVLK